MIPNILTIAGSDPSGGAGIQAGLKTISACGAYGAAVITALTAQNTRAVTGVHEVPPEFVALQIDTVFADLRIDAVTIGMVANATLASVIGKRLRQHGARAVVLDPVMVAKSGDRLLAPDAVEAVRQFLLPMAMLITPNLPEAAVLLGSEPPTDLEGMRETCRALHRLGPANVLLKGGHLGGETSPDVLFDGSAFTTFEAPRIRTKNTHGTGDTLASAIASLLPQRPDIASAIRDAKTYTSEAIAASGELDVGTGHGPVHHFHTLWSALRGGFRAW
ncbi:bifunctional hydroxymethylpyrimidine kinase/phosphomethylpyrimidine kinase [Arenibaculum pallidiluteum]|uniref:bifunctional hydroxymethylpyrimidine kinase/phosphomethylpyrimidine kinase n=1 Tax=Arenibaculum pallidiluteum TaxID=2812559 RepID=UPI001A95660D|nr:bifunctional hydroxymethylpyrimidine kinase/phosphomethylpyrimidine kinase [Arenibaculum pallidiluteum]